MSVTAICPECREEFAAPDDGEPIRCPRCDVVFPHPRSAAIQAAPAPRKRASDLDAKPHARPRPASTIAPVLILIVGVLLFLLVFSVGFNIWLLLGRGHFRHMEEAMRAEMAAREQEALALAMAQLARVEEEKARQNVERAQQRARDEIDALKKEIERLQQIPEPPAKPDRDDKQLWGTLEGRVVFKGELPKLASLIQGKNFAPDINALLQKAPKDQLLDPTWRVDPKTRGVANVCVYLKRPADGKLPIHPDDASRPQPVVMDAPFAIFTPHLVALYPEWIDGTKRGKTGQKLVIKNSSPVIQNQRMTGHPRHNAGSNRNVAPSAEQNYVLNSQPLPLIVWNDVPPLSSAYIWVFDHPYFAITKADGTFTIPRVPAGMEVHVMAWHESQGWLFTKDGRAMTLKVGKNTLDFEIGAK